jgi:hypothetical protein
MNADLVGHASRVLIGAPFNELFLALSLDPEETNQESRKSGKESAVPWLKINVNGALNSLRSSPSSWPPSPHAAAIRFVVLAESSTQRWFFVRDHEQMCGDKERTGINQERP